MDYHLPEIKGIDWETAHRYIPEKEVLFSVLKEYVSSAKKQVTLLQDFREQVLSDPDPDHFASYRIQAHAMKAALRSLGSDLFDSAFALETAGKEEDLEPIQRDTDAFCSAYLDLAERFKVITGDCDIPAAFDETSFFALVEKVASSMAEFDISGLQEAFGAMQSMSLPEQYQKIVDQLEPAVRDLESDVVADCCERLRDLKET